MRTEQGISKVPLHQTPFNKSLKKKKIFKCLTYSFSHEQGLGSKQCHNQTCLQPRVTTDTRGFNGGEGESWLGCFEFQTVVPLVHRWGEQKQSKHSCNTHWSSNLAPADIPIWTMSRRSVPPSQSDQSYVTMIDQFLEGIVNLVAKKYKLPKKWPYY